MKSVLLFAFVAMFCLASLCQTSAEEYKLSWIGDGALLATGLGSAILSEFLLQGGSSSLGAIDGVAAINAFDRSALFGYSKALDVTSDVLQYATAAIPVFFGFVCRLDQAVAIGVVYLEALAYAFAAKNLLKYLLPRYRPYLYSEPAGSGPGQSERSDSFPSGHAAIAFTAATFSVFTFKAYFPSSPYLVPFALASYGLATLTATFRVVSGMHFMTDVLAGAVLGVVLGYVVPLAHRSRVKKGTERKLSLVATPDTIMLEVSY